MTVDVDICNRALQMVGSRVNITSLTDEDSEEAKNCSLLYTSVRDQVLGMAFWNFARKMLTLGLVKAAPGTPEAQYGASAQWINTRSPALPWLYEYQYPTDCIQFRYIASQAGSFGSSVPIFSTPAMTFDPLLSGLPQRFVISYDKLGPTKNIVAISQANPAVVTSIAHGFSNDFGVYISGVEGMVEINNISYNTASVTTDTFALSGINSTNYTPYVDGGIVTVLTNTPTIEQNVILTNAPYAVGVYTRRIDDVNLWGAQAQQALISALAGFLAIPLAKNVALSQFLLARANTHILEARATDGNEGFTTQDVVPDWIRVRSGMYSMGDSLGYYVMPYPPLFAVS